MPIERIKITGRDQWLEARKNDVTASVVASLFGCHPYVTALHLYAEKRGTEFVVEDNSAMRRGRWLEPAVALAVEELRPEWKLEPAKEYLRDPDLRLGCTPDFIVHGDPRGLGICQTKTVSPSVYAREWDDGKEVPLWIILQASVEAWLADAAFIVVAALLVDAHHMDVSIHEMPRNPAAEDKIRAAVAAFWKNVEAGTEPEPDFARDADVIKAMWRTEKQPAVEIDLSGNNMIPELLAERAALKASEKAAHERIEAIDAEIKYEMKDAAVATGIPGWRVTFKTSHFKAYTVQERDARVLRISERSS